MEIMEKPNQFVVFSIEGLKYALSLSAVERVVRAVEVTPLPKAPDIVIGAINVGGRITPVVNIRKRFQLPEREIALSDQIIIANIKDGTIALVVDSVSGVIERSEEEVVKAEKIVTGMDYVNGVVKFEDDMVLIHDIEKFLSLEEKSVLNNAMQ